MQKLLFFAILAVSLVITSVSLCFPTPPPPPGGGGPPPRHKADAGNAVPESSTRYTLLGTISSELRTLRRAILWAEGISDPLLMREQQEVEPGVRVSSIERAYVMLIRGGREEKLELLPVGSRTRISAPPPSPAPDI